MSDSGTNFPPQTYSSVFNLNVMTEGENGVVPAVSSTESETKQTENPRMRDCFTSSMDWKVFVITLICCLMHTNAIYCNLDDVPGSRVFATLLEFQGNKLSFDRHDDSYAGSSVNFSFESVDQIVKNSFISYTSEYITSIDLSNKSIKTIGDGTFISLTCLYTLDLSNNRISNITSGMFMDLTNLRTLDLSKNRLNYVSPHVFFYLKSLQKLDLSYNNISEMNEFAFDSNPTLETLNISHNFMKHIRSYFFNNLLHLRELCLDHNLIAIIHTNFFSKNILLKNLDLSGNGLVLLYINKDSFHPETMQLFNLSNNYLMDLNVSNIVNQFSNTKTTIDLNDNQFYCNEWKQYLSNFKENNVTIAPGRNFSARRHINGIACDNLNFTLSQDYNEIESLQKDLNDGKHSNESDEYFFQELDKQRKDHLIRTKAMTKNADEEPTLLPFKYVIIALSVIGTAFCVFLTLDYVLGVRFSERFTRRIRLCMSPTSLDSSDTNSDYVQLQSAS